MWKRFSSIINITNQKLRGFTCDKYLLSLIIVTFAMCLILFAKYVFLGEVFMLDQITTDIPRINYPVYSYFYEWISKGAPLWTFQKGIGTSILSHPEVIFDPFTYIVYILGKNGIDHMIIWQVIAKILAAGIFSYMFFKKRRMSGYACIIASLCYSFSSCFIISGTNLVFATAYVYLPLILYGFELLVHDGKNLLLIIAMSLLLLLTVYFFYMTMVFFAAYVIFRYFEDNKFNIKQFGLFILKAIIPIVIALLITAFWWYPTLCLISQNPRLDSGMTISQTLSFQKSAFFTAISRFFGNFTLGKFDDYQGYSSDFLECTTYCGILTILIVPHLFRNMKLKERIIYMTWLGLTVFSYVIGLVPYIFNGFAIISYRFGYVIAFSFALFLGIAVDNIFVKGNISLKLVYRQAAALVVLALAVFIYKSVPSAFDKLRGIIPFFNYVSEQGKESGTPFKANFLLILPAVIAVTIYATVLLAGNRQLCTKRIKIVVAALFSVELIVFNYGFVSNVEVLKPQAQSEHGFFDASVEALKVIESRDSGFYRVEKDFESMTTQVTPQDKVSRLGSLSDSLVQDYYGLRSYASTNNPNYIKFLTHSGVYVKFPLNDFSMYDPKSINGGDLNFINGVGDRWLLQDFLGVKYFLSRDETELPTYYEYITTSKDIDIYRSPFSLPLGMLFDKFITYDEYMTYSNEQKDIALMSTVVASSDDTVLGYASKTDYTDLIRYHDHNYLEKINNVVKQRQSNAIEITNFKEDYIEARVTAENRQVLLFTIPYDDGWSIYINGQKVQHYVADIGLTAVNVEKGEHEIRLVYFPVGMKVGIIVSCASLVGVIGYCWIKLKAKKDQRS